MSHLHRVKKLVLDIGAFQTWETWQDVVHGNHVPDKYWERKHWEVDGITAVCVDAKCDHIIAHRYCSPPCPNMCTCRWHPPNDRPNTA